MAYQKIPFTPDWGGVTDQEMNHIQTQYDEAAADLNAHKSANPIDHPDGSVTAAKLAAGAVTAGKLADGAVDTLTRIASGVRTTPGGTEASRLAVTDAAGAVGLASAIQVVIGTSAALDQTSADTFQDTSLSATITPTFADSIIIAMVSGAGSVEHTGTGSSAFRDSWWRICDASNGQPLVGAETVRIGHRLTSTSAGIPVWFPVSFMGIYQVSSLSPRTFRLQFHRGESNVNATVSLHGDQATALMILMEVQPRT